MAISYDGHTLSGWQMKLVSGLRGKTFVLAHIWKASLAPVMTWQSVFRYPQICCSGGAGRHVARLLRRLNRNNVLELLLEERPTVTTPCTITTPCTTRLGSLTRQPVNIIKSYMMYISVIFAGVEEWPHRPIEGREIPRKYVWICSRKC